jgi:nucleoside-diphosphate-sugar epimerase
LSSKTVVVTGAAGFIGSHLTDRCLSLGWRVYAVDAFTAYYDETLKRRNIEGALEHPDCTLIDGDLRDLDLAPILADASVVFHLAAQPGVRTSWDDFGLYTNLNLNATQRLLDAARQACLERVVIASSSSIYGDAETFPTIEDSVPRPVSPYGITKVATEQLAHVYYRSFGVPTVCLRYFTVYGPRQRPDMAFNRLVACALGDEPFVVFGDGDQTRDFTYVADAVSGTISAGECGVPGSVYNVGGGSRRSMNSVFRTLENLLGAPVNRDYQARQLGDARDTAADISRARRELGFEPSFDFAAGLKAQLDWQRSGVPSPQALA